MGSPEISKMIMNKYFVSVYFFKKKNNIFGNHAILFTEGMKEQWDKGGNNLLLGDGTGGSMSCWNQSCRSACR